MISSRFLIKFLFKLTFLILICQKTASAQIIDSIHYDWTVYEYEKNSGKECYVASLPRNSRTNYTGQREPHVLVTLFNDNRAEEVSIYSGYEYKLNSDIYILANDEQFKLFTNGDIAWFETPMQDKAAIQTMLESNLVKVRSDSAIGNYAVDEYSMKGFARAYSRMKELCK